MSNHYYGVETNNKKGFRVGFVANQTPVINPHEALKGAHFIRMCNQE